MQHASRPGAISIIVAALAGIVWIVLESTPVSLGFEDTDDPSVMVRFITQYPEVFLRAGVALLVMAVALTVGVFASADAVAARASSLALRSTTALGLFGAAFLFVNGALRIGSSGPLLHMAGLRTEWGEGAYIAVQMFGTQGVAVGGILAFCLWAVGLSLIGARTGALPRWLCLLGILPAIRAFGGLLGLLGFLPDEVWVLFMLAIPGTFVWCLALGLVLLRRSGRRGSGLA